MSKNETENQKKSERDLVEVTVMLPPEIYSYYKNQNDVICSLSGLKLPIGAFLSVVLAAHTTF